MRASSWEVEGLGEVVVGPALSPATRCSSPSSAVSTSMGSAGLAARTRLSTVRPSTMGRPRSSTDVEMLLEQQELDDRAVGRHLDPKPALDRAGAERIGQDQIVFGEQSFMRRSLTD